MKRIAVSSALVLALAFTAGTAHAASQAGPTLVATVPLPALHQGDYDQFAVDLRRNRLYVSAEANNAIEVFNLHTGALIRSGGPVKAPHKLAVDEATGRLFVADGGGNAVEVLNEQLKLIKTIPTGRDPDGGIYDPNNRTFYVGSQVNDPTDTSMIEAISTATMKVIASVPVAAHTLKAMIIDPATDRLFVSMRDKNEIGVIDLKTHTVEDTWSPSQMNMPVPLALDRRDNLLFVGARQPGKLFVLNAADGHVVQVLPSTNISDSMWYDAHAQMLYVTGASGMSVYRVADGGRVKLIGLFDTGAGKSSLLVSALNRIYVARPKTPQHDAALEIYTLPPMAN